VVAVDPKASRADEGKKVAFGEADKDRKSSDKERRWKMPSRYQVAEKLGQGAYGCVCEAHDAEQNRKVAIKRTDHLFDDAMDARRTLREVAILSLLRHDNVVRLLDVFAPGDGHSDFNELYVVMELCDSDLRKLCRSATCLSPLHLRRMLWTLLCGLKYVHSAGVYHRDLKPANCLVNQGCDVKICDFGLARAVGGEGSGREEVNLFARQQRPRSLTGHVVTRWYRAPELILLQEQYTELIDMWSVGCIYAELLGMLDGTRMEERGPLFPGSSCFPLSPDRKHRHARLFHTRGSTDQLNVIFEILGTPCEDDVSQLKRTDAREHIRSCPQRKGSGLGKRLPWAAKQSLDLLARMLVFAPKKRVDVSAALEHSLLASIRRADAETTSPHRVTLDFDKLGDLSEGQLRKFIGHEVSKFHTLENPSSCGIS